MSGCEQLRVLSERHKGHLRSYQEAMATLFRCLNTPDFKAGYEHVERCRDLFEKSREAMDLHTLAHGCVLPDEPPLFKTVPFQDNKAA
jgi:hypothetical protein